MKVIVNNISLFYETTGSGAPLILLHGNGEDHHIFDKIVLKLKNDFTVYAIDSRNHGQSDNTEDYSYDTMVKDTYEFISALKLGNVNIAGFSDGAIIALLLAMKHDIVKKMALLGINLKPSDFTEESYAFVKETYEETNDPLFKMMLEQPNIELNDVKSINVPALIIAAENDIFKPKTFTDLRDAMPAAILTIMAGHEHDSYIVNNDMLYEDFAGFFK